MTPAPGGDTVLAVDLGTTGLKVGVAGLDGRLRWCESHELTTSFGPGGRAEQDAGGWWRTIAAAVAGATRSGAVDGTRIAGVGITGQWASTVPVDEAGKPVAPCLMWMDTRGRAEARRRVGGPVAGYDPRAVVPWVRRSGGAPALDGGDPLGHRWFLAAAHPDVVLRARWLLEPVDYLAMRFSGRAVASPASMTAAWLVDTRDPHAHDYDDTLVRLAGVDSTRLAPMQPTGSVVGPIAPDVADALGISPAAVVVAGMPDLQASALGAGAVDDFAAHMAVSTTSWVTCHVARKKTDVVRNVATVPGARPGRYVVADNHDTAGRCLHWLRQVLGDGASPTYGELDEWAAGAAAGSGGTLFTPWLAGTRTPVGARGVRASFTGLGLGTTRADMVRAVMEGVALHDRWLLETVDRFCDVRLDPVRLIGGGAVSALWCQMHADVTGRTIEQVADPLYCGLRGAAFAVGVALGRVTYDELAGLTPLGGTFRPDCANAVVYDRAFAELPALHKAQSALASRLRTGRPRGRLRTAASRLRSLR